MITKTSVKNPAFNLKVTAAKHRAIMSYRQDSRHGGYSEVINRKGVPVAFIIYDGKKLEACDAKGRDISLIVETCDR